MSWIDGWIDGKNIILFYVPPLKKSLPSNKGQIINSEKTN